MTCIGALLTLRALGSEVQVLCNNCFTFLCNSQIELKQNAYKSYVQVETFIVLDLPKYVNVYKKLSFFAPLIWL